MFKKKKGFTASQSKRMSRRMESNMVGSHVVRPAARQRGRHSSGPYNASGVEFSNGRRSNEANRGFVSQVGVSAQSGESDNAYSRRVSRRGYVEEIQRRSRIRRIAFLLAVVLIVALVAGGVGVAAYFGSSDSRLSLGDSNAKQALVSAEEGKPYYVLMAADLGTASGNGGSGQAYMLARVDEASRAVSFLNVPANMSVLLSDGKSHPLSDAVFVGGDAELIARVAEFVEVDIAHFVSTDGAGLGGLVSAVGGVTAALPEEVDDPRAGIEVLPRGEQSLQGASSLVALRAMNYADGLSATSATRTAITAALAEAALSSEGFDFASLVSDAGSYIATDFTASKLIALGDAFRPFDTVVVHGCLPPGYETGGASSQYVVYDEEWAEMLARFKAGEDPNVIESSEVSVNPADVTVEVRNGAGATGAATRMGEMLAAAGYVVESVGNTDDNTTYPETLVIYKDSANEGAAKAVVKAVGGGRSFDGGDFYAFETDVLVIIGQDWMPVA